MAVSLLATVNAMCLIGPRVYYAMAHDGAFFAVAGKLHPRLVYYIGFTLFLLRCRCSRC